MKFKVFIFTVLVVLLAPFGLTHAQERAPFYGVVAGTMIGVNDFGDISGGFQTGMMVSIDASRGLMLRTLYTKAQWGDVRFSSVRIAPLLTWYAGHQWEFYVVAGGDRWTTDSLHGGDYFVGLGLSRRLYTSTHSDYVVPFTIDAFMDFASESVSPFDNTTQIVFGLQFSKPIKKE